MNESNMDLMQQIVRISGVDPRKCMQCGKCSASCNAYDEMEFHPHQYVAMIRDGKIDRLMKSESMWSCVSCFACIERCPRDVEPAKLIEAVRIVKMRAKDQNHMQAMEIPEKLNELLPQQAITSAFRKYTK